MSLVRCTFAWAVPVGAGYRCPAHAHACTELVYSDRASGVLRQEGRAYAYRHGSVFIYQPGGADHWIENRTPGEHVCIGVVGCRAEALPPGIRAASSLLARRFGEIRDALREPAPMQATRLDLLAGLAACDLAALLPGTPREPVLRGERSRAGTVREYIESALHESLTLADLAKRVYVSPDYLRQLFRQEFGESVTRYIVRRRIELAAGLLRSTPAPVKEIAAQAGFSSEYYFSRTFRKLMGKPPATWRRAAR